MIASRFEDATRVVKDNETGFLFSPGDKDELRTALRRAYEMRTRLSEMGGKAREEIVAKHSWVARVQDLLQGVEAIVAPRGPGSARYSSILPDSKQLA